MKLLIQPEDGIAPLVEKDLPRALALAAKTPMPLLADSIYWYAGRTPAGRDAIVDALADAKTADDALLRISGGSADA